MIRALPLTLLTVLVLVPAGCQKDKSDSAAASSGTLAAKAPPAPDSSSLLVKTGEAPMRLLFAAGGKVRIVDATSQTQLVRATIAPQTAITLDAQKGIAAGPKTLLVGPLPAGHRYEIWLDRQ